ncbi:beta-2 adrenergic receptor-like [Patiria miniata]|uniref:G-protein coupled receptors family 1 profile domain-containing protein n=1 Tax=Patiria miniata TaxID=46514 RepID=A0A914B3W8_PATMI|nr:beta-2 adrenergic receptor-like [Patiria miniata]
MDNVRDRDTNAADVNLTADMEYDADSETVFLLVVYGVIGTLGIIGNGLVILVYMRSPSFLRNVTSSIVCNQSAIDLAMSVLFVLINLGPKVNLPSDPAFANFLCKVWLSEYVIWALGTSSTCNLVYLTIERYVAVFHPFYYRSKFTLRKARLICVIPWFVGPIHELGWGLTNHVTNGTCTSQWPSVQMGLAIGFLSLIDHYVIPLCIMAFVYSRIICKLRHARRKADADMPSSGARRRLVRQASRNVIITTFLVSLTYLVCWGPNEIMYFYVNMGGVVDRSGVFYRFTVVMALVNMCVNPFIYAMCYKDFRRGLWLCLRRGHAHNAHSPSHSHDHDVISTTIHGFHEGRRMIRYKQTAC